MWGLQVQEFSGALRFRGWGHCGSSSLGYLHLSSSPCVVGGFGGVGGGALGFQVWGLRRSAVSLGHMPGSQVTRPRMFGLPKRYNIYLALLRKGRYR